MHKIYIHEVGPRDGLQVEEKLVPLEEKVRWIEGLFASGIDIIQLGSFVHPKKVPQMADTDALFEHFSGEGKEPCDIPHGADHAEHRHPPSLQVGEGLLDCPWL